ncbi:MAG: hypothetical protein ACE362_13925 [Phaeodactylibacter xiamenensis]|uniref:Uncharacterized protein n=1 Tax=Phaeodactylibacter xiamenensis TaxID=1524460 RepID=A0A098S766_9BACT|nr:hypothetical protein [Phaeodactylibacter xiamenensis]KGE87936.1 hypothetical protein IX84_12495 [Phaeodactylibacter xiamenensis]MCR9054826.1 hypothetical protein [bacterium]
MNHTTAYASKVSTPNEALPYDGLHQDKLLPVYLRKVDATMHAAGGLMTTGEDAARFLSYYLAPEQGPFPTAAVRQSYEKQVSTAHEFVEMAPGSGMVICFGVEDGKVVDFSFGRDVFERVE